MKTVDHVVHLTIIAVAVLLLLFYYCGVVLPDDRTVALPTLAAATGLPSERGAEQFYQQADAHLTWVESHSNTYTSYWRTLSPRKWYEDREEAYQWRWTWSMVRQVRAEKGSPYHVEDLYRRQCLKALLDRYGWKVVLTSEFPPPRLMIGK